MLPLPSFKAPLLQATIPSLLRALTNAAGLYGFHDNGDGSSDGSGNDDTPIPAGKLFGFDASQWS